MLTTATAAAPTRPAALVSLDGRSYPLESVRLDGRAEGGMASSTLHQRFLNPHEEALEVVYTMPLPADGAVLGYVITVGDRRIEGVIRSREAAEAAYREALYQGRTAGILEQERADTFRQRVGNIPPGVAVEVEIHLLHPLAFRPGLNAPTRGGTHTLPTWEYRFPTVVGVRYMGAEGRVPDAGRIDPDRSAQGLPVRLELALTVADATSAGGVHSPSHPLRLQEVEWTEEWERGVAGPPATSGGIVVSLAEGAPLDRDLVVAWGAAGSEVGVRVVEGGGLPGDRGRYAMVTVVPPALPTAPLRREVTVLLDTSGSMDGLPLALGKQVVRRLLESLDPRDRFELLAFGSRVEHLTRGMQEAVGGAVPAALARLDALRASGGTEMRDAVEEALRSGQRDAQRQVILVTDGYIGFEGEVVAAVMGGMAPGVRFHAVGVGAAPNRTLTGGLTRAGRGVELFALDASSAERAAGHLVAATRRPILTDVRVTGGAVVQVAPAHARDVMEGQPLVLTVELAPEGGSLVVEGVLAGSRGVWSRPVDVPAADAWGLEGVSSLPTTPLPVGAIHGRELIADLELEEASGVPRHLMDRRIEAAGLRHRIVSRRTSLVAVAAEPSVDPRDPRRQQELAVEFPAGVSAEGVGLFLREGGAMAPGAAFGGPALRSMMVAYESAHDGLFESLADMEDAQASFAPPPPAPMRPTKRKESASEFVRARGSASEPRSAPEPGTAPVRSGGSGHEQVDAEVILHSRELLVVELEVPSAGFILPRGEVTVVLPDGREVRARVELSASTGAGPHSAGVRVRLALRPGDGGGWHDVDRASTAVHGGGARVQLHWSR